MIESDVPELSVIVLCYRAEEGAVQLADQLAEELASAEIDYELVLVANHHEGMTDATPELVSNFAKRHLRAVAITGVKEGMMGWDMRSGLRAARGAHIAVIDGDGQMPMSDPCPSSRRGSTTSAGSLFSDRLRLGGEAASGHSTIDSSSASGCVYHQAQTMKTTWKGRRIKFAEPAPLPGPSAPTF